jgi:drug/metabolite transporter (DMT)-like permease
MTRSGSQNAILGGFLVLAYTGLISSADAITKQLSGGYSAAQLFGLSGFLVVCFCFTAARFTERNQGFRTSNPTAMLARSAATVVAAVSFFHAFQQLPFAEVFLFIGLMPLLAGLFSGLILQEHVRPISWLALVFGFIGVLFLFPTGLNAITIGHIWALSASVSGTLSIVLARFIGRRENNALTQVFYPNLAICASMAPVMPFVWKPMPIDDVVQVAVYAVLLFAARWVVVVALRHLTAYAVTPLMNLQFVWMVAIGAVFFHEFPTISTYFGAAIVIGSGLFVVWEQFAPWSTQGRWTLRLTGKVRVET